ncbi:autotransporter outer membrane beta-barrel domain-containing protein, partial [Caulobacter sp. B11]|uniref:autotransporter domain-containing protein n=1 Tax=Caulobacter sp. B11 TaxID=2048899 RepID=UPI000C137D77
TQAGTFALTVTATDSTFGAGAPFTVGRALTLAVSPAPPPVVEDATAQAPYGAGGVTIDLQAEVTGLFTSLAIVSPPAHGTAVVSGASVVYTPAAGFYGADGFDYQAVGPGGTSGLARVAVTVAAAVPVAVADTAATPANQPVSIAVTANDSGPLTAVALASAPAHGVASLNGLNIDYAPASDFFGTDSFTYTASGPGGTSGPATVTVTVSALAVPVGQAKTLVILAGQPGQVAAGQGASGSPTGAAVATAPAYGAATVSGLTITYAPAVGFSGADSFTYTLSNAFGTSAPVPVTVTVNPVPLTAPPITIEILAGQVASLELTAGASGGPFTAAAITELGPNGAGTATITAPSAGVYRLTFTPAADFAGTAQIGYTLTNAFATSAPGRVTVIVNSRPDPGSDPDIRGLIAAQDAAARRFVSAQLSNYNRRMETLHGGGAGVGGGNANLISLSGGSPDRPDGLEAMNRFRRYAALDLERQMILDGADGLGRGRSLSATPSAGDPVSGGSGAKPSRWGVWAAGSADFGLRDTVGSESGFRFTTDGLTFGADYRVGEHLAVGVGLGYGRDSSRIGQQGAKSRVQGYSGGAYASYQPIKDAFIDGVIGVGSLDFDSRRVIAATDGLARGERGGDQLFGSVTAGIERRGPNWLISPYGRLGASRSTLDAFAETGGGVYGLTFAAQTVRTLAATLGLRGDYVHATTFGAIMPRVRLEYSHDFEDPGEAVLTYSDWLGGPAYRVAVDPIDRNLIRLELGVDFQVTGGLTLGFDLDNSVGDNSESHGLRVSVQSPF